MTSKSIVQRPSKSTVALWIDLKSLYGRAVLSGILAFVKHKPGWSIPMSGAEPVNQSIQIVSGQASGLIGQFYTNEQVLQAISFDIPVVNVTDGPLGCTLPTVCLDNPTIGRMAAAHLMEVGCTRLYCLHDPEIGFSRMRWKGFSDRALEDGIEAKAIPIDLNKNLDAVIDKRNFSKTIRRLPEGSGVFGVNDTVAFGFLQSCVASGRPIPSDIAVMGCNDDDILCQLAVPSLTSIEVLGRDIGYKAAELLDSLLGRRPVRSSARQLMPPGRLIARESSDRLATLDANLAEALRYIREHANRPIYAVDVVDANKLGRRSLEKLFKLHVGHGIYEEIRLTHLQSAEELLQNSQLAISEIATLSGFVTAPCLERAFIKKHACTASFWRKSSKL
jgi:LacI family transcriptional regulator